MAGEILIDDENPGQYFKNPKVRVGYVGAEPFLVAGTIRDNLRYGLKGSTSDADCWSALAEARLEATIRQFPAGLDYKIKENGDGLSAGQKQRLSLARAFLAKPVILILDEVSANLDMAVEAEIRDTILELKGKCTVILVSHRLGIIEYADRTLSLAQL